MSWYITFNCQAFFFPSFSLFWSGNFVADCSKDLNSKRAVFQLFQPIVWISLFKAATIKPWIHLEHRLSSPKSTSGIFYEIFYEFYSHILWVSYLRLCSLSSWKLLCSRADNGVLVCFTKGSDVCRRNYFKYAVFCGNPDCTFLILQGSTEG